MIDDRVFLGFPLEFKDICKVYPPTVNDVSGNNHFYIYQSLFTMTQEELEDAYLKDEVSYVPTPFEYLLINYHQDEEVRSYILEGFQKFLREPVTIEPEINMILIGVDEEHLDIEKDLDNPRLITAENYFEFQNLIRAVMGERPVEPPDPDEDPRIKRIKAKGRYRDKLKAKRQQGPKFGTLLAAICCMGIGLTPLNIGEMSYACVQWLIAMEQQRESYDVDIRALLAGADSKKVKPKYWIKNIS
jgi:hypothetical protein